MNCSRRVFFIQLQRCFVLAFAVADRSLNTDNRIQLAPLHHCACAASAAPQRSAAALLKLCDSRVASVRDSSNLLERNVLCREPYKRQFGGSANCATVYVYVSDLTLHSKAKGFSHFTSLSQYFLGMLSTRESWPFRYLFLPLRVRLIQG